MTAENTVSSSSMHAHILVNFSAYGLKFSGYYQKIGKSFEIGALSKNIPSLADLLSKLPKPVNLPIIPDVKIDELWFRQNEKFVSLKAKVSGSWFLPIADNKDITLTFNRIIFSCDYSHYNSGNDIVLSIDAGGSFTIPDVITIPDFTFNLKYDSKKGWNMNTNLSDVTILGHHLSLNATYEDNSKIQMLRLAIENETTLIDKPKFFSFTVKALAFNLKKNKTDETIQIEVSSKATLAIAGYQPQTGTLYISDSCVKFKSDTTLNITLFKNARGSIDASVAVKLNELILAWGIKKEFRAESKMDIVKDGLPVFLKKTIPDSIDITFKIAEKSVSVTGTNKSDPIPFELPDIRLEEGDDSATIPLSKLGEARLKLCSLNFELGESITISTVIGVGLPKDLNNIFGTTNGQPNLKFFNTESLTELRFSLSFSKTLIGSFSFITPPILPEWVTTIKNRDGSVDWNLKLGPYGKYGEISIGSPQFEIQPKGFKAEGNLKVNQPLQIPLKPFKQFLGNTLRAKDTDSIIPNAWPIQTPALLNNQGRLNVDVIINFLNKNGNLPEEFSNVLNEIDDFINDEIERLPESLLPYLEPQFEGGFKDFDVSFAIQIGEDGSLSFDLENKTPDPKNKDLVKPIRLLWPMIGPVPTLVGCKLNRISFGTLLGGSLFKLKVDGEFDTFDLPELLIGLTFPKDGPIPLAHDFHNHLKVKNLLIIIEYESGFPLPIPIFYDELGWEYLNVAGFEIQAHASFPNPLDHISIIAVVNLLQDMLKFFTIEKERFYPKAEEVDLFPNFALSRCFVQLPKYIGNGVYLGDQKENFVEVKSLDIIANVMNTIKFFSMQEIIEKIPLKDRKGSRVISDYSKDGTVLEFMGFALKDTGCTWLFTTPEAFTKSEYKALDISLDEANALLNILPNQPVSDEKGAIIFLKANLDISYLASCAFTFGFVGSANKSLATGFKFQGSLLDFYRLDIAGKIIVDNGLITDGYADISLFGIKIISENINMSIINNGFVFSAEMNAFQVPSFPPLFSGLVDLSIDKKAFHFDGEVDTNFLFFPISKETLTVHGQEWKLSCGLLGIRSDWIIKLGNNSIDFNYESSVPHVTLSAGLTIKSGVPFLKAGIKADFVAMQYEANFNTGNPKGIFKVGFLNLSPFISGDATFKSTRYSLKGTMNFYFGSVTLGGEFSFPNAFQLSGSQSFGIHRIARLKLGFTVGGNGIGVSGSITFTKTFKTSGEIAYSKDLGCPAIYLSYTDLVGYANYMRIGFNGSFYWKYSKPDDWPAHLFSIATKAVSDSVLPENLPKKDLFIPLLHYIKRIYDLSSRKDDIIFQSHEELLLFHLLRVVHQIELTMIPDDESETYSEKSIFDLKMVIMHPNAEIESIIKNDIFKEFGKQINLILDKEELPDYKKQNIREHLEKVQYDTITIYRESITNNLRIMFEDTSSNIVVASYFDYDNMNKTYQSFFINLLTKMP